MPCTASSVDEMRRKDALTAEVQGSVHNVPVNTRTQQLHALPHHPLFVARSSPRGFRF